MNYIYVDYENVRDVDLDLIANKPVKVILAVGPSVKNLPVALFEQALTYASQVRLLKSVSTGKDALDLLIAADLGKERDRDPKGFFHIYSRDRHFDSVVENLRAQDALIERRESLSHVPVLMNAGDRLVLLKERLSALNGGGPKSREALEKYVQGYFNQSLTETEITQAVNGLKQAKVLTMDAGGTVSYLNGKPKTSPLAKPPQPSPAKVSPPTKPVAAPNLKPLPGLEERVKKVRDALAKHPNNRPSKEPKLRTFISNVFRQEVPEGAMKRTLKALEAENFLTIDAAGKVVYPA